MWYEIIVMQPNIQFTNYLQMLFNLFIGLCLTRIQIVKKEYKSY